MSHAFYVIGSYLAAGGICLGLIAWTWLDGRARQAELKSLEEQGIRRRSAIAAGETSSP
ncbi:heme exporter protein CcmD [Rhizobium sp. AAP43]|uniref:heme exporter protein CcmD n=1 Tax=Rhizobium sp. AAP43 TaxID=1523420 RepID=UPI0006B9E894|nr:heme exporter protein CcmD [Rhizobium sp. AAP43]KPF42853.1 hemagglutination activity protein [Rhizobium sp. AAP43]